MLHRDALVDKPGRGKGIMRRLDDHNALLFRLADQLFRHLRILTDHQAAGVDIHCAGLGLIAVPQDHQVVFLDKFFHHIRVGSADGHLPLGKIPMFIASDQLSVQGLDDIPVLGPGLGQDPAVVDTHIGIGDISRGDHTHQFVFLQHRHRLDILFLHLGPGVLDGYVGIHALDLVDVDILHLKLHVLQKGRGLHPETAKHVVGLLIDGARPPCRILLPGNLLL